MMVPTSWARFLSIAMQSKRCIWVTTSSARRVWKPWWRLRIVSCHGRQNGLCGWGWNITNCKTPRSLPEILRGKASSKLQDVSKFLLALIISWCHVDFYRIENAHIGMFWLKWIEALIEMQVPSVNLIGITFWAFPKNVEVLCWDMVNARVKALPCCLCSGR